jgi:hypothetical protein
MKEIILSKLIKDKDSVATLLRIYKALRGKENLEKRLFLKTLIWASLNPNSKETGFRYLLPPSRFFNRSFTIEEFNRYFNIHINELHGLQPLFGHKIKSIFGNIF